MTYLHDELNNITEEEVVDNMDIFDEEPLKIRNLNNDDKLEYPEEDETDDLFNDDEDDTNSFFDDDSDDDEDVNHADEEEEDDLFSDEDDDEDDEDLFMMKSPKRKAKLPEGEHLAKVGDIKVEKMPKGRFDKPWTRVTIPFEIKHPKTGETITVPFFANKSTGKNSRLYPIIKGIFGHVPEDNYSLKDLIGKKVRVEIEHNQDDEKNVWENVVLVRPYRPKK